MEAVWAIIIRIPLNQQIIGDACKTTPSTTTQLFHRHLPFSRIESFLSVELKSSRQNQL
jgi:hypothetical protein